jgi:hypothetical protein
MGEFRDAWLLARELLGVEANPLDELGIVTDVIEDEEGINRVGLPMSVSIRSEVPVLSVVESNGAIVL